MTFNSQYALIVNSLSETISQFKQGQLDKATFIRHMYEDHHRKLFELSEHLARTNVKKISIEDGRVIIISRDRGVRIVCVPGDHRIAPIELLNFGDYEKEECAMIESLFSDGDTFFDIGANIGWYSINVAVARRASTVYSFEPIPKTFKSLQENVALNAVLNLRMFNYGFSNTAGELTFYYYPEQSGNASSVDMTGRTDAQKVQCWVRTLDDFTEETAARPDFIKCDVEGGELFVFQGGAKTLERDKPIVFAEILRKWAAKHAYDPNEIFDFFRRLGYRAYTTKQGGLREFSRMDDATAETNFFFLHGEKHELQIDRYALG